MLYLIKGLCDNCQRQTPRRRQHRRIPRITRELDRNNINYDEFSEYCRDKEELNLLPKSVFCPINYTLFTDPVLIDGHHTFDRSAINDPRMLRPNYNPITNLPIQAIETDTLVRDIILNLIRPYQDERSENKEEVSSSRNNP